MQIKLRGKKFQLIRYSGYSAEKKRAAVEVIGSIDQNATSIPAELAAKLTSAEVEQLTVITQGNADSQAQLVADTYLQQLPGILSQAQSALNRGQVPRDVAAIFEAMKNFKRAMKDKGFEPAKREPKQAPTAPGQQSFLPTEAAATTL